MPVKLILVLSLLLAGCHRISVTPAPREISGDTFAIRQTGEDQYTVWVLSDADLPEVRRRINCEICTIEPISGHLYRLERIQ